MIDVPQFSIIIPVYNRPQEVSELLESLANQTCKNFEVILIEDGSSLPCDKIVKNYTSQINIFYYSKPNSGRSSTRNYGMERANGNYLLFFDSDCILPNHYIEQLTCSLANKYTDCFGGPDKAHHSFTSLQKAISYTMTSFFTTGGIRGNKRSLEKFVPRTFNMGFSKKVYDKVGGFKDIMGEDIDLSTRISQAGYSVQLIPELHVYHKRRVSFRSFFRQVYIFGMARVDLYSLHHQSLKIVHLLPAMFVIGTLFLLLSSIICPYALLPLLIYGIALFGESLYINRNLSVALLSLPAAVVQLGGYGLGFITAVLRKWLFNNQVDASAKLEKYYNKK